MWTPPEFRPDSPARTARLIRENPFAVMTSMGDGVPLATHVPVIRRPGPDGPPADEVPVDGSILYGHMARANAHWHSLIRSPSALVVFSGPNGYVSPTTYGVTPAAPTWNYAAVHVTGRVRVIDDADATMEVIRATVAALERGREPQWDLGPSLGYARRILPGVVAFEIDVLEVRATFKLSQDKPAELRERVIAEFAASGRGTESELAALMTEVAG
ncbi:FMN-binding negative transcriptional regulator [Nonomuraea sp. NPDC047897]|uniref:FMN-binding negative transcriptional regulator n=1 Tax=Nonomuraea sp. NPDC047897 TaxID=3364346 RepID=UPI0037139749